MLPLIFHCEKPFTGMVIKAACVLHTVLKFIFAEILPTIFFGMGRQDWYYDMDKAVSLPVFSPPPHAF